MSECVEKCKKDFGAYVVWPDQPITIPEDYRFHDAIPKQSTFLGHAGVLIIEGGTGLSHYYEFGRYNDGKGEVKKPKIPNVKNFRDSFWGEGWPSEEDIQNILSCLPSSMNGYLCRASLGETLTKNGFEKMKNYAESKRVNPPEYKIATYNCSTFAQSTLRKGQIHGGIAPWPVLSSRANQIRDVFSFGETHVYQK